MYFYSVFLQLLYFVLDPNFNTVILVSVKVERDENYIFYLLDFYYYCTFILVLFYNLNLH